MIFRLEIAPEIEIRQVQPPEAATIYAAVQANRARLREWLPWVDQTRSIADVEQFIERCSRQLAENLGPNAGIWIEGRFSGAIGCHAIDWANRRCSIGYWLDRASEGKGVMTRCCAAFLDYLFDHEGLHRITIQCATGNTRSCAIPKRLGFDRVGVMREAEWVNDRWLDLVVWGMLAPEWRVARSRSEPHLRAREAGLRLPDPAS